MKCRKSTTAGYECNVFIKPPFIVKDICGEVKEKQLVSFDACLAKELFWLWDQGIKTIGSCCGKHIDCKIGGFIQVAEEHIIKMKELGYEEDKNYKYKPCNSFIPKSIK